MVLEALRSFDDKALEFTQGFRNPLLDDIAVSLSALCSPFNVFLSGLTALIIDQEFFKEFLILMSLTWITVYLLKYVISRDRPSKQAETGLTSSMPSAHAATAFTFAVLLSGIAGSASALFFTVAFLVGVSRVYLELHYPSDVISGSIIGILIATLL